MPVVWPVGSCNIYLSLLLLLLTSTCHNDVTVTSLEDETRPGPAAVSGHNLYWFTEMMQTVFKRVLANGVAIELYPILCILGLQRFVSGAALFVNLVC